MIVSLATAAPAVAQTAQGVGLGSVALAALVAGAWLAIGAWALVTAARCRSDHRTAERKVRALEAMLAAAPSAWAVVEEEKSLRLSPAAARLLRTPPGLVGVDRLAEALSAEGVQRLEAAALAIRSTGRATTLLVGTRDGRQLWVDGRPATEPATVRGSAVLWLSDATETERSRSSGETERGRLLETLDALSALVESAPFPMWLRGSDMRLRLVNTAFVRAVEGSDAGEVVERGLELIDDSSLAGPMAMAERAAAANHPIVRTAPAIIAGERRMLRLVDVPLGPPGVAGFALDVEETEQLRAEIERLQAGQRATLDRLSAAVALFAADRSLAFFNLPFVRLFGLDTDWLAERPEFDRVLERMREGQRLPEVRDFPTWRAERRGWFTLLGDTAEESWSLPGGEHLRVLAQPHADGGLLLVFEDRTEHMRLASARDTLLRVQAATLDNLFEAVGVFAGDGRLRLWNRRFAELWSIDPAELNAHPHVDALAKVAAHVLRHPQRADLLREFVRSATADRRQRSGRFELANGRHLEFAAVPLPDGNALFTLLDVTDSRRIEAALRDRNEALEAADRIKSQFVSNMSYELRTPLTTISGYSEMLKDGYSGALSPGQQEYLDAILSAAGRLQLLIDDILDLSSTDVGVLELERAPVDVGALVRSIAAEVEATARARELELIVEVRPGAGSIDGDERRLRQSISNVVDNALSYTPGGGRVVIVAEGDDTQARITVSDSGIGIPADEQARVFDSFHRVDGASGRRAAGLGLALVRRFVTLHGGSVSLASEVGKGTTVTLSLPRTGLGAIAA